ncbi:hypothetical protein ES707_13388 [subsurface metagenome]
MKLFTIFMILIILCGCTAAGSEFWEGTSGTAGHLRRELRDAERDSERRDVELERRLVILEAKLESAP